MSCIVRYLKKDREKREIPYLSKSSDGCLSPLRRPCVSLLRQCSETQEPVSNTNNDAHNALIADEYLTGSFSLIASQQPSEDNIFQKLVDQLDFARIHYHRQLSIIRRQAGLSESVIHALGYPELRPAWEMLSSTLH